MWVKLDRLGEVLLDATLGTSVMMSVVVLLMLLCSQPARRIAVARPAVWLAMVMIPLAAYSPLPRYHPFAWFLGPDGQFATLLPDWCCGPWPLRVLTLAYAGTLAIGLSWLLLGFWAVARLIGKSEGPQARTRVLYEDVMRQSGLPYGCPELRVSRHIQHPVVVSLIRPYVLIPPAFEDPRADFASLRWALVHELAHARGSDSRLMALVSVAQSLWFFLPFLHWMRGQLRLDQEFLADQRAVAIAGSSAQYATRLVSLAHPRGAYPIGAGAGRARASNAPGSSRLSPLLQRVLVLLRAPFPLEDRPPRRWAILASLLVMTVGGACSSLSITAPNRLAADVRRSQPASSSQRTFRIDHFLATPRGTHASGRSLPYLLPLPLPTEFELTVEIDLPREGLRRMRLAGLPLEQPASFHPERLDPRPPMESSPNWHHVQLRRTRERVELSVDDRHSILDPVRVPLSEWLTIEPPSDLAAVLRNLIVTW